MKNLLCLITVWFALIPTLAVAQTTFIDNNDVRIDVPDGIQTMPCSPELAAKAGDACMRLGADGNDGVLFYRQNSGYALNSTEKLEKHIQQSIGALSDIPNVRIQNGRILQADFPLGMIDLVRTDAAVAEVTQLSQPPIRQLSLIVPLENKLGQLFIYLPEQSEKSEAIGEMFVNAAPSHVTLKKIVVPGDALTDGPDGRQGIAEEISGSLGLLPRALMWGGSAALLIIIVLHVIGRKRRKQREED